MITPEQLKSMVQEKLPAAVLREKLAVGLQQETEEERQQIQRQLRSTLWGEVEVFKVVLDAACNEVIVPSDPQIFSVLQFALKEGSSEGAMAVVERMRKEGLRVAHVAPFRSAFSRSVEREVEDAVVSVIDPIVYGMKAEFRDTLRFAIGCSDEKRARAIDLVLKHGPTMEERLEAGIERFRYIHNAARSADFKTLQQMHDLLPLLPDGSGRRGELSDYAIAIGWVVRNTICSSSDVPVMLEYLEEQAGDEKVFDHCPPFTLLFCRAISTIKWLVARAPQLAEAACKDPDCLSSLIGKSRNAEFLAQRMAELVDREVLCSMMQQSLPAVSLRKGLYGARGWRWILKPIHDAVPECMDGLKWKWLVEAIEDKAHEDVEYMLSMCTREHLVMRNEKGDTAYDMATRDNKFPRDLLEGLKVVTKGAHA